MHRRGLRHAVEHAALLVVNSEHTGREVVDVLGVEPERLRVAHLGVGDEFRRRPAPAEVAAICARHLVEPGTFVVAVGAVSERKNLGVVLRALAALDPAVRPVLVAAGPSGIGAQGVVAAADRLGLSDTVRWAGFVDHRDLPALVAASAALVHPSRAEGFGLTPLEAMASGVPALVSDVGAVREVTGGAAILLDPDDADAWAGALAEVVTDADRRAALVAAAPPIRPPSPGGAARRRRRRSTTRCCGRDPGRPPRARGPRGRHGAAPRRHRRARHRQPAPRRHPAAPSGRAHRRDRAAAPAGRRGDRAPPRDAPHAVVARQRAAPSPVCAGSCGRSAPTSCTATARSAGCSPASRSTGTGPPSCTRRTASPRCGPACSWSGSCAGAPRRSWRRRPARRRRPGSWASIAGSAWSSSRTGSPSTRHRAPRDLRTELGVPPGSPLVGSISRLVPQKAPGDLVAALRRRARAVPRRSRRRDRRRRAVGPVRGGRRCQRPAEPTAPHPRGGRRRRRARPARRVRPRVAVRGWPVLAPRGDARRHAGGPHRRGGQPGRRRARRVRCPRATRRARTCSALRSSRSSRTTTSAPVSGQPAGPGWRRASTSGARARPWTRSTASCSGAPDPHDGRRRARSRYSTASARVASSSRARRGRRPGRRPGFFSASGLGSWSAAQAGTSSTDTRPRRPSMRRPVRHTIQRSRRRRWWRR